MLPKPQWEKDNETLTALRAQIKENDVGRHVCYGDSTGLTVRMWSGTIINVPASECTPHVAASFLSLVGMGSVEVLKPIFEICTLFQAITPAKGSKPLTTFF